jgi:lipid-A-disaccharide synthase
MINAGEASGDTHAAKLVNALRGTDQASSLLFFGAAGPKMRAAGVEAVVESDGLSIVGLFEIGKALPMFLNAFRRLKDAAIERKPDVAILVDFPDFNMKLAKALKKQGITVVYYISPQLWAWRKYRISTIRKYVDLVISILPFEKDWYAKRGIDHVEYVGSPLAREVHPDVSKEEFCAKHGIDSARPIISLLPGSRHTEISRILPDLLRAAEQMRERDGELQFLAALPKGKLEKITGSYRDPVSWLYWIEGETYDALNASDAAAITSGTATLEAGIIGTPMAIVYKTSATNYRLLRPLIDVEHFGLINLIAGERVANEFIQDDFTPETLSTELFRLLKPNENARVRGRLQTAADKLGHGGASKRAAEAILRLITNLVA